MIHAGSLANTKEAYKLLEGQLVSIMHGLKRESLKS